MRSHKQVIPTYLAVITAIVLFVGGWMLTSTAITNAHTVSTYYGTPRWSSDPQYGLGALDSPLNTASARQAIHSGDDEWDAVAGAWLDFNWSGVENSGIYWLGDACVTVPQQGWLWIMTHDLTTLALEATCLSGSTIVKSVIRLDDVGVTWHTDGTAAPAGTIDLRSAIIHEFGHAGGFGNGTTNHFSGSDCSGTIQTMCQNLPAGTIHWRTLESHDKHTFASAYPG